MAQPSYRNVHLRFIVYQDGDWLCAQCLEFDLGAQARSLRRLYTAMDKLIRGHIEVRKRHGLEAFKGVPPAPAKFREMFEQSKINLPTQIIALKVGSKLPTPEVRIAAASPAA